MNRHLGLLFGLVLALATLPATAPAAEPTEILNSLRSKAAGVATIVSDFKQEKRLSMFDSVLVSTGRFYFDRPDKLRWEYIDPLIEGFAISGDKGTRWTDSVENRRQFVLRQDPVMHIVAGQLLAWATFDLDRLRQEYDIALDGASPVVLRLTPRGDEARRILQCLLIEFSPSGETVARVELREQGEDFTRITFSGTVINQPLDAGLFR